MLWVQDWNVGALVRLLASLFVCQLLGAAALAGLRWASAPAALRSWGCAAAVLGAAACSVATLVLLHRRTIRPLVDAGGTGDRARRGRLAAMFGCLYAAMVLAGLAQQLAPGDEMSLTTRTLLAALCFQGAALVLVHRFVGEHRLGWAQAFGLDRRVGRALAGGVLTAAVFLPAAQLLQLASAALLSRWNIQPQTQPAVEALQQTSTWLDRALMGVVAIGLAPVAEEILFRGILFPALRRAGWRRVAWWGTAVLFAAVHWNAATFVPLALFALLLTWLYERTGNLLSCVAAHATFNGLNFAMFYLVRSVPGD